MVKHVLRDRGAALITVLLFVVLVFILITAMLSVTGNEVVIAALQRDRVQAVDLAQAGIQEAINRIARGRPYSAPFPSALDPRWKTMSNPPCPPPAGAAGVCVTVTRVYPGTNSAYLQIDATASNIGRATRTLTALVLQEVISAPPNVTFAYSVTQQGSAAISCGDAYSQTFLQYKSLPTSACAPPQTITYTGWRVSKVTGGTPSQAVPPCYTHMGCVLVNPTDPQTDRQPRANWYPNTRQTTAKTTTLGQDILGFQANADPTRPTCKPTGAPYNTNLPAGAILPDGSSGGGLSLYGYDTDTPPVVAGPASAPTVAAGAAGTPNGTYTVVVTFWTPSGESAASPASAPLAVTNQQIAVSAISPGPAGTTARGVYAFKTGVSSFYQLVDVVPDNTTPTFTISTDQASWTTPLPTSNVSQLDPDLLPCGLPYKWVSEPLQDENGAPLPDGVCDATAVPAQPAVGCRWFKTVIFDEWFLNYWWFDETKMTAVKRGNGRGTQPCVADPLDPNGTVCLPGNVQPDLIQYPQFGAVPPFPDTTSIMNNYDCMMSGGGVINSLPVACTKPDGSAATSDLGYANPQMGTAQPDRQVIMVLGKGTWQINGNLQGHGTIVVNGDLVVNGTFTYYGTIIVNGTLQAGTGNVTVYGGLVAQSTLQLIGNITVNGGGTVTNVPTGNSLVFGKAWLER